MGFALLRAPLHPAYRAREAVVDIPEGGDDEAARLTGHLLDLASDAQFREAIAVSSTALTHSWDAALAGTERQVTDLRRAVRALTAYRSRMATRATPFGLMAGVAVARIAPRPQEAGASLGTTHRRVLRPEHGWLTVLVREWERRPEVVRGLRVQANNLCVVRGDRLVVPTGPDDLMDERPAERVVREVSVRYTAAVRAAVESARGPVPFMDLGERLAERFPQAYRETVVQMLMGLVESEVLLTDLHPPTDHPDPIGHVLAALAPSRIPEISELRAIARELGEQSEGIKPSAGDSAWRPGWESLIHRMGRLRKQDRLVQVDLALDAEVCIPPAVGAEAERAAHLLWRLSDDTPSTAPMVRYHRDFLERYGVDRAVPVKELLDPDIGLGAPAGYRHPPSCRTSPGQAARNAERDRLLLHLAQEATVTGVVEVVLTDDHPLVVRLARDHGRPPAGLELFTRLVAASPDALRAGEFRLVVDSAVDEAGASFGRFAHLFSDEDRTALADMAAESRAGGATADALRAQVLFRPRRRAGNVTRTPRLLGPGIPVGAFAEGDGDLDLEDLAVRADSDRLFVVRLSDGREVVPAVYHRLHPDHAPNVARLLGDIPRSGARLCRPWDWGSGDDLPYTPRVRYGRAVLALARWRPAETVCDQDAPFDRWVERVDAWRERWRVPERICLTHSDQRIELLLSEPAHLRLLRRELRRRPDAVLHEVLDADDTSGWLLGEGGAHRNELVFPMLSRTAAPERPRMVSAETREAPPGSAPAEAASTPPTPTETTSAASPGREETYRPLLLPGPSRGEHLPGGEWLYALVHCSPDRHQELLGRHLPRLLHALPDAVDRWFFVRYRDQDDHVRLRFHGTPGALAGTVLPDVHRWAADLRAHGLIQRLSLDTYAPEYERYGGPDALAAAERAFHADSLAVVETLALRERAVLEVEPLVVAAAGYVHLLRAWQGASVPLGPADGTDSELSGPEWLVRAYPKDSRHKEFQRRRAEAVALIDPYGDWAGMRARPGGEAMLAAWDRRSRAVADYRRALLGPDARSWSTSGRMLSSLLHMHHNRLNGVDREGELVSVAVARGAVQAHWGRRTRGQA
ncbi:lantibiotic dehydratase [Streptomyces chattanoogensis]|uniref:Lantibiotic dehydratase n=1 Tax=Streptomyces chattanoogensis TaxID=66876 RepID=A0A0N0GX54_9ACTN|nr:lantibiotic dehydratase [Streptomyces chattanoogensis]KPC60759.1 hypothetical protein ADL29_27665 [Streptomyces chattanoogensis]